MPLTPSQRYAEEYFKSGSGSMLLTGDAGTGKTHLVDHLKSVCRTNGWRFAVVAPRGAAAFLGGGETIHKFIGPMPNGRPFWTDQEDLRTCLHRALKGRLGGNAARKAARIANVQGLRVLFLDEFGLADAALIAMLDLTLRATLQVAAPFGGLVVVLVGDPWQMTPFQKGSLHAFRPVRIGAPPESGSDEDEGDLCYRVPHCNPLVHKELWPWADLNPKPFVLRENMRQEGEDQRVFREMLGALRGTPVSQMTPECRDLLLSRCTTPAAVANVFTLYWSNEEMTRHNEARAAAIGGELLASVEMSVKYENEDAPRERERERGDDSIGGVEIKPPLTKEEEQRFEKAMERTFREARNDFTEKLPRKGGPLPVAMGGQLMLLTNKDIAAGQFRGSIGTVVGVKRSDAGDVLAVLLQLKHAPDGVIMAVEPTQERIHRPGVGTCVISHWPLDHGYAATYDAVQGMTLPEVVCSVNPGMGERPGMFYMGCSRVPRVENLWVVASSRSIVNDPKRILLENDSIVRIDPYVKAFMESVSKHVAHADLDRFVIDDLVQETPKDGAAAAAACAVCGGPPTVATFPCRHVAACAKCWDAAVRGGASCCLGCRAYASRAETNIKLWVQE